MSGSVREAPLMSGSCRETLPDVREALSDVREALSDVRGRWVASWKSASGWVASHECPRVVVMPFWLSEIGRESLPNVR